MENKRDYRPRPGEDQDAFMDRMHGYIIEDEIREDRRNYWKAVWWLIKGRHWPEFMDNNPRFAPEEGWCWKHRIGLLLTMLVGKRGVPKKDRWDSVEVMILEYNEGFGVGSNWLSVEYWPWKLRWDFLRDSSD